MIELPATTPLGNSGVPPTFAPLPAVVGNWATVSWSSEPATPTIVGYMVFVLAVFVFTMIVCALSTTTGMSLTPPPRPPPAKDGARFKSPPVVS